jgi:hypothetical protein
MNVVRRWEEDGELWVLIIKAGSIYSFFGHPNRQNPLICRTTVV